MNLATIDIGTNTALLLVARLLPDGSLTLVEERAEITRLGRGIGTGSSGALGTDGIARTLAALQEFATAAHRHRATIAAIGTEALRRAPNAAEFLDPAAEILGTPIGVIDGAREAALTFNAVADAFPAALEGALTVIDIGGGSTEIVIAAGGKVMFNVSLPLGSVRLTERFVHHDPPRPDEIIAITAAVDAALAAVPFARPGATATTLVGVAGTVTSLAAMAESLVSYDPARVHGYRLSQEALAEQIARLRVGTQAARERIIGLDPRRADVILAGALILQRIAAAAGVSEILVSDRGIRWGLMHELAAKITVPSLA
jgi:exopolyphosphatase / guanosine-5'-triphosphate,3'-diphosphate pyrophosphatase